MTRSVILCLTLLFAVASAINTDTCTQDSACNIAIGDSCDSATFPGNADCVDEGYCASATKKCTALPSTVDADCSESNQCATGFYCDSVSKKCAAEKEDGEACTSSTQCKNSCSLTSKKCVSYKYTLVGNGDSCAQTEDGNDLKTPLCTGGTYCDSATKKCVKRANKGEDCTTKSCNSGLNCGSGKICVAYYSVAVGETCDDDDECVVGAKCDSDKCVAMTSSEKGCNETTTCGPIFVSDESCYCTKYGGIARCLVNNKHYIPTGDKCKSDIDSLHSCLNDKKNCASQESAASCCLTYEFDVYTDAYRHDKGSIGGKEYAELCDAVGCSASGSTVVAVSQLAVVAAALFALLF